jgi:hypothetical protein
MMPPPRRSGKQLPSGHIINFNFDGRKQSESGRGAPARGGSITVRGRRFVGRKLLSARMWKVVSLNFASWNQLTSWLHRVERLRHAA